MRRWARSWRRRKLQSRSWFKRSEQSTRTCVRLWSSLVSKIIHYLMRRNITLLRRKRSSVFWEL